MFAVVPVVAEVAVATASTCSKVIKVKMKKVKVKLKINLGGGLASSFSSSSSSSSALQVKQKQTQTQTQTQKMLKESINCRNIPKICSFSVPAAAAAHTSSIISTSSTSTSTRMCIPSRRRSIHSQTSHGQNRDHRNIIKTPQQMKINTIHVDSQTRTKTTTTRRSTKSSSLPIIFAASAASSLVTYNYIYKYNAGDGDGNGNGDGNDNEKKSKTNENNTIHNINHSNSSNTNSKRPRPRPPRQFGSKIPYALLERNSSSPRRSFSGTSRRKREDDGSVRSKSTSHNSFGSDNNKNSNISSNRNDKNDNGDDMNISGNRNRNRSECAMCKKYSRGPCGALFTKWLDCIDEHDNDKTNIITNNNTEGNEGNGDKEPKSNSQSQSLCDKFIPPLNECLKEHQDYYDNINFYDDDGDDDVDDDDNGHAYGDEGQEKVTTEKWTEFILELESQSQSQSKSGSDEQQQQQPNGSESGHEHEVKIIETLSFPPDKSPDMQIRLDKHIGIAAFHSKMMAPKDNTVLSLSSEMILLLAYIKDQNGTILAAASADDLLGDGNGDEMCVLRFHTENETKDVIACGLYSCTNSGSATTGTSTSSEETHESTYTNELYYIYRKVERLPPS